MGFPVTGLVAFRPLSMTPVFSLLSSARSRSLLRAAAFWYSRTSSMFSMVSFMASIMGCSGDTTI